MSRKWRGTWPAHCNLCGINLTTKPNFVDGKLEHGIHYGRWGLFCLPDFLEYGAGFGIGKGQLYDSKTLERLNHG